MTKYHKLSKEDVLQIILLYRSGNIKQSEIAERYGIDTSTVNYHLKNYAFLQSMPDEQIAIWFLRKKQSACLHTSLKCSTCELYRDNIKRDDYYKIKSLAERVNYLENVLKTVGVPFEKRVTLIADY